MEYIPYSDRYIELPSGYAVISPYMNKKRLNSMLELWLDNNALIGSPTWIKDLNVDFANKIQVKENDGVGITINPYLALVEQYLSNESYREKVIEKTNSLIKPWVDLGIKFEDKFEDKIERLLKNNEKQYKTEWMISYLYIILLYRITFSRKDESKPFELLKKLKDKNVPCFTGLIMLCSLAKFLNKNQNIKMTDDNKTAFSYLSSFIDKHGGKKGEDGFEEKYFRNRAGDLSFWLAIPKLLQNGYSPIGELMVVTKDKALKKFIFKCFPFVWNENNKMAVSFDKNSFDKSTSEQIRSLIKENIWDFEPLKSKEEQLKQLENLKNHVIDGWDEDKKEVVENIWNKWIISGWGQPFQTSLMSL